MPEIVAIAEIVTLFSLGGIAGACVGKALDNTFLGSVAKCVLDLQHLRISTYSFAMVVGVATTTNATPLALLDLAMATYPCRSKWCTSNNERVLQDNVLPRITRVATRIMSQHQEVVATCAIATPKVWLL
jgi:hypothetical protein